jgi:hypothetical protein
MSLGSKIPVEPLSEARVTRIGRALFEQLDRNECVDVPLPGGPVRAGRWRRLGFASGMTAVILGCLGIGFAALRHGGVDASSPPARIMTGVADSHVVVGNSWLDVAPESAVVVSGDDEHGVLVVLDRGSVTCDVAPRAGRPPFVIRAGITLVRVVGTRLTVTRSGDSARVEVTHGTVEVSAEGQTALVHDGESWPGEAGESGNSQAGADAATIHGGAHLDPAGFAQLGASSASGARVGVVRDEVPVASVSPTGSAPRAFASPSIRARPPAEPPNIEAPGSRVPAAPSEAPAPVAAAAAPTPQALFEEAAAREGHDPSGAAAIYRRLSAGDGPWAMNALFAEASLEQARGNVGEARRLLEAYVARYPRGRNAGDARAMLARLR